MAEEKKDLKMPVIRISSTQRASKKRRKRKQHEKQYQAQTTITAESFKEKSISKKNYQVEISF